MPSEIAFEGGVGAEGTDQASIKVTVIGIASNVAGIAECADQRGVAMDTGSDAQEVVMREVTDDDVALPRQGSC